MARLPYIGVIYEFYWEIMAVKSEKWHMRNVKSWKEIDMFPFSLHQSIHENAVVLHDVYFCCQQVCDNWSFTWDISFPGVRSYAIAFDNIDHKD